MSLKSQIEQDLKTAMLAGDKVLTNTLKGIKSAVLYEEVAQNKRDEGLSDTEVTAVLSKEAKKRQESADLYKQGGNNERAQAELSEKSVIEKYLPAPLSDEELEKLVDQAISEYGQNMGQIIGWVKSHSDGRADGQRIANVVKARLNNS